MLGLRDITGKVQALYFVVRPTTTGLTGDNAFSFTEISQFEIRDGGSQNIIGGSPVKSTISSILLKRFSFDVLFLLFL